MNKKTLVFPESAIRFKQARITLNCDQEQWARIFCLGKIGGQSNISKKEQNKRKVNMPEDLAAQLLLFIAEQGYEVKSIKFDDSGKLVSISRQTK